MTETNSADKAAERALRAMRAAAESICDDCAADLFVKPNVRVNPDRGGKPCKAGRRRWYCLALPRLTRLAVAGRGLNEGLGLALRRQQWEWPRILLCTQTSGLCIVLHCR